MTASAPPAAAAMTDVDQPDRRDVEFRTWLDSIWYLPEGSRERESAAASLYEAVNQIAAWAVRRYGVHTVDPSDVSQEVMLRLVPVATAVSATRARRYVIRIVVNVVLDVRRAPDARLEPLPTGDGALERWTGTAPSLQAPDVGVGRVVLRRDLAAVHLHRAMPFASYLGERRRWMTPVQPGDPPRAERRQWCRTFEELRRVAGLDRRGRPLSAAGEDDTANDWLISRNATREEATIAAVAAAAQGAALRLVQRLRSSAPKGQAVINLVDLVMGGAAPGAVRHASLDSEIDARRALLSQALTSVRSAYPSARVFEADVNAAALMPVVSRIRARWYQRHKTAFDKLVASSVESLRGRVYAESVAWGAVGALGELCKDERRRMRLRDLFEEYL